MKILITGANGQLGIELQRQLKEGAATASYEVIPTDYNVLDITSLENVQAYLTEAHPDVVINCAAHTAVDKCEEDVEGAYRINSIGARNLAMVCDTIGAKLVQVSTDYVFSGAFNAVPNSEIAYNRNIKGVEHESFKERTVEEEVERRSDLLEERTELARNSRPWREDDVLAPQSIYGTSKLAGEDHVKAFCKKYFIIRTAWLYGEGNNFVRTMIKLAGANKELSVVGDQFGNPTSTKDLATAIINLMHTEYYGTYHGTCEGTCSWYDFATKIFEIKGIDIVVNKVTSEEFVRAAKRPAYSSLDNFMLKLHGMNTFRSWEEALKDYLAE